MVNGNVRSFWKSSQSLADRTPISARAVTAGLQAAVLQLAAGNVETPFANHP